jgi:DEAD/DEAH box helicase domain-containing protein
VSPERLVFYAGMGSRHAGYRICLECGRAEEEKRDGRNPLSEHTPLRGTRDQDSRFCPGGTKSFAVTEPIALGHEVMTDVAELQPALLEEPGAAWALVSALREALARRLGVQPGELGMAVEPRRGALGQATHSLFLFDRNAGGAGFASRLLEDVPALIDETARILSCDVPGCVHSCASCVLTPDLFANQEIVDRKAALSCIEDLLNGMRAPQADDAAVPEAMLSPPAADAIVRRLRQGNIMTLFAGPELDQTALSAEPFVGLFAVAAARAAEVRLAVPRAIFDTLNAAQRLGLRDLVLRHDLKLYLGEPPAAANGAALLATVDAGAVTTAWFTRDPAATVFSPTWGIGSEAPVVCGVLDTSVTIAAIDPAALLPQPDAAVRVIAPDNGRALRLFGSWFAKIVREELEPLGLWQPGKLARLRYSDRYLRSPHLPPRLHCARSPACMEFLSARGSEFRSRWYPGRSTSVKTRCRPRYSTTGSAPMTVRG